MPISNLRKKKLLYVSNVFFVVNQSGTIEKKDFELTIEKICTVRGWPQNHPKNVETYDTMIEIRDGLRQRTDANKDGQVSVNEWSFMWDELAQSTDRPLQWQQRYMNFIFDLEDASNDGSIDVDEFTTVCSCHGLQTSECN